MKGDTLRLWLSENGDIPLEDAFYVWAAVTFWMTLSSEFLRPDIVIKEAELLTLLFGVGYAWYNSNTDSNYVSEIKVDPFGLTQNLIKSSNWPDHYSTFGDRNTIHYGWNVLDHGWGHVPGTSRYIGNNPDRVEEYYNWAVQCWNEGNRIQGLRWLGRASHLMEDANYPPHGFALTPLGIEAYIYLATTGNLDKVADGKNINYFYYSLYNNTSVDINFDVSDKAEANLESSSSLRGYCDGINPSWWNLWYAREDDLEYVVDQTLPRACLSTSGLIGKFLGEVGYLGEPLPWIANVTENSIDLQWVDNSTGETEFEIWRTTNPTIWDYPYLQTHTISSPDPDGEGWRYSWCNSNPPDPTLWRGQPYWYKILARNAGRESDFSKTISATALWLNPVTQLTVTPLSYTRASLTWMDNSNYEAKYRIEPVDVIFERSDPGTGNSVTTTIDVLEAETPYDLGIRALDSEDHESPIAERRKLLCKGIEEIEVKSLNGGMHVRWEKADVPFPTQTLVVRKQETKGIGWEPTNSVEYTVGQEVETGIVVVYVGDGEEFIDGGLENYATFCYKAFSYDEDFIYAKEGAWDSEETSPVSLSLFDARKGIGDNNSQNIVVDQDGVIHMVYASPGERPYGGTTEYVSEIWYIISSDGGANWSEPLCLTENLEPLDYGYIYPSIAIAPDGTICVVWVEHVGVTGKVGEDELYFTYTEPGGWHPCVSLGMPGGHINPPSIAVGSDGMVHIAADVDVPPPVGVDEWICYLGYSSFEISEPDINFPQVTIAFHDNFNYGPTNYDYWEFSSPAIAVVGNVPHIVWGETNHYYVYEEWGTNSWIYHASGGDWDVKNTIDGYGVRSPSLAVSPDGSLIAVWIKESYPYEVRLSRFDGNTWSGAESVGSISDYSYPVVTVSSSSDVFVIWSYDVGEESVVACRRKHLGQWDNTSFNLTKTFSRNYYPHITLLNEDGYEYLCGVWAFGDSSPYSLKFWRDTSPKITVFLHEYPNQGGKWRPGWTLPIEWGAKDNFGIQSQELWLATSTGEDIQKIADAEIGQSSYDWAIDAGVGDYRIKVKACDEFENLGEGLSEEFTVSNETVFNPDFEEGFTCWMPYGDGYKDVLPNAHQGVYSLYISREEATGKYFGVYQKIIPCNPNTTYWLTGWVKTSLISGSARIALGVWSPYHHHSDFGDISGNTDWTYVYGSWTSGSDEDTLQITLYGNPEFYGFAYFDDIQLIEDNTDPSISGLSVYGTLESGETVTIGCNASDDVGIDMVQYFYATNPCGSWMHIGSITPRKKHGTFGLNWLIPSSVPVGKRCYIKGVACDPQGQTMEETTGEMLFIDIHPPEVSLICPNDPTNYDIGDTIGIEWEASDNSQIEYIKVFVTRNYGDPDVIWEDIVALPGTDTIFYWAVNTPSSNRCRVKVIAYDKGGNQGEDLSNSDFTIADISPPEVTVLYPVGGERWEIGGLKRIEWGEPWDNVGVDSVRVILYTQGGKAQGDEQGCWPEWDTLAVLSSDSTHYDWEIPGLVCSNCKIIVVAEDRAGNEGADTSSWFEVGSFFSTTQFTTAYSSQRKVCVDNSGNIYAVYHSEDVVDRILFDYSPDNGSTWEQEGIGDGRFPAVCLDNTGEANLCWVEEEDTGDEKTARLYYKREDWENPSVLIESESDYGVKFSSPSMVLGEDNTAHIVITKVFWSAVQPDPKAPPGAETRWTLIYIRYDYSSGTLQTETLNAATTNGFRGLGNSVASIDIDADGILHLVWTRPSWSETGEVYYIKKTDTGWSDIQNISETPDVASYHPFIEIYGDFVDVVWEEEDSICYRKRWIYGDWEDTGTITDGTSPQIMDGCVLTYSDSIAGRNAVFYKVFDGIAWGDSILLTYMYENCKYPQMGLADSILSVIWTEDIEDIYKLGIVVDTVFIPDAAPPVIDLLKPVGGERWEIGGLKRIEWSEPWDNVGVDSVRVLFTSNYPNASWDTIATLDPETTYYNWEIPDVSSSECRIKVIAFDRALNVGVDMCEANFEIGPLFSTTELATAYNSQKKLYVDSFGNIYMVYHSGGVNDRVLLGHYSEKCGKWCQKGISDGRFPANVAYSNDSLGLVWTWKDTLFFRKKSTEWADTGETYRILVVPSSTTVTVEITPPSIAIVDDTAHIAVEYQKVDKSDPGNPIIHWRMRYGKFPIPDPSDTNWTNLDFYDSNVQEKGVASFTSSIDIDRNGSPHVAWRRPYGDGENEVYYKVKTDGSWSQEVNISESPYVSSSYPFIDIYGDFVNIVWKEGNNICHRKKWLYGDWKDRETIANGASPQIMDGCVITYSDSVAGKNVVLHREFDRIEWGDSVVLSDMYKDCKHPQMSLADSTLSVVWTEDTDDIYKVGMGMDTVFIPWQKSQTHLATSYNNGRKLIRDADGRVHIVYQSDGNIFYTYTDDSLFSCDFLVGEGTLPCISLDGEENPWVMWRSTSCDTILFSKFDYDSFTTPVSIYKNDSLSTPSFVVSEDDIAHISFSILNPGECKVIYGIFDGNQLAHIDTLDTYEGDMTRPSLAVEEEKGRVMVVWDRDGQIYYRETIVDKEWDKIELVSGEIGNSCNPQIDYYEGFVYVVWQGGDVDFDIYHASKPLKGKWTEPIRLANTQDDSKYPVIGGGSHVVWEEGSGLGPSIYYFKVGSEQREPENLSEDIDAYCPYSVYYAPPSGDPNLFVLWTQRDVPYKIKMIKKVVTSSGGKMASSSSNATGPGNAERLSAVDGGACLAFTSGSDVMYAEYRDTLYQPVRLGSGGYPLILSSGGNTNIVWQDSCGIYSSVLSDGWSEPDTILTEDITYNMPLVVASSNHGYHIGRVTRSGNLWRIKHGIKRNNGFTESLIDSLNADSITSPVSMSRDRIGNIHIVWEKNGSIYYTNFVGMVYGEYDTLSNTGLSKNPSIDVYGGRVRVVWENDGEVILNSKWLGHSWESTVNISETPDGVSRDPFIRGNAVIWSEEGCISTRVFCPDVMDWGNILQFPSQCARYPQLAFYQTPHSTDMWLAWTEGESAPYDVMLKSYKVARVPYICLDLGKEEPSVFTIRRGGYIEYGEEAYGSVDTDPTSLVYRIMGLDPAKRYRISVTYYQKSGEDWEMRLLGDVNANTVIPSNIPTTETQWIPEPGYLDGALTLCITKVTGDYAICSGIIIYEFEEEGDGGGAQSAGDYWIFGLSQNYPNPFTSSTVIRYSCSCLSRVSLKIYDITGRLVRTLVDGKQRAGRYTVRWDGKDNKGRNVASGVYFVRLTAGEDTASRKLVILR